MNYNLLLNNILFNKMSLNFLPVELALIINDYAKQINHQNNFSKIKSELKETLKYRLTHISYRDHFFILQSKNKYSYRCHTSFTQQRRRKNKIMKVVYLGSFLKDI